MAANRKRLLLQLELLTIEEHNLFKTTKKSDYSRRGEDGLYDHCTKRDNRMENLSCLLDK